MSLKRVPDIARSLRFRLTLSYGLLFTVSALCVFACGYWLILKHLNSLSDQHMKSVADRIERRYMAAFPSANQNTLRSIADAPASLADQASNMVDDLSLKSFREIPGRHGKCYEFLGTTETMLYELTLQADGSVESVYGIPLQERILFLRELFELETSYFGVSKMFLLLRSAKGTVLTSSDLGEWRGIERTTLPALGNMAAATELSFRAGMTVRTIAWTFPDGTILQVGINTSEDQRPLTMMASASVAIFLLVLILSSICGWFLSRHSLAGVKRVVIAAQNIGPEDLTTRVPRGNEGTEIDELVSAFNEMLTRIEGLVEDIRQVSDNVAHDLRTPLTRIRCLTETSVSAGTSDNETSELMGMINEECIHLTHMIDTMLEITRLEARLAETTGELVDLTDATKRAVELFTPQAEDAQIKLRLAGSSPTAITRGKNSLYQRVIANLLDNAIKYTDAGGNVSVSLEVTDRHALLTVADTGIGIRPEDLERIFDRFYRCDSSRSLRGNGLGLSLAQAIVKANGGQISVTSEPSEGTVFMVHFPLART